MQKALIAFFLILAGIVAASPTSSTPDSSPETAATPPAEQIAAVASAVATNTPEEQERNTSTESLYRVTKVIDGDTLTITKDNKNVTLRLIGLDTPETVDPRKEVQCFGREASDKAKEVLTGHRVRIEADPSQGTLDKYGRTLAYLYLEDGTLFNKFMIENGFGHEYTYQTPYKFQQEFKTAEKLAREGKRGLWNEASCAPAATKVEATQKTKGTLPVESTLSIPPTGNYICSKNAYNCSDFKTQAEAQAAFMACGGTTNDIHQLDRDSDGSVCESLP